MEIEKPFKDAKALKQYIKDEYIEDNNAVIHIKLQEDTELFNSFSYGNQLTVNSEILDYINEKAAIIPNKYPLIIRFHGYIPDSDTQEQLTNCLINHYKNYLHVTKKEKRRNRRQILLTLTIGLTITWIYLSIIDSEYALRTEMLGTIGSFAIWTAFDMFLFERWDLNLDFWKTAQKKKLKVEFTED